MIFAETNPLQLAPIVGKTQVGITISAASSSIIFDSATPIQAELVPLENLKIVAKFPVLRPDAPDRRTRRSQAFKSYQDYIQRRKNRLTRRKTQLAVADSRTPKIEIKFLFDQATAANPARPINQAHYEF